MAASLVVTKTGDLATITVPGLINYTIDVENDGTVDLTGIVVTDTFADAPPVRVVGTGTTLTSTSTWTYTAYHLVSQYEIDNTTQLENVFSVVTNEVPGPTASTFTTQVVPLATGQGGIYKLQTRLDIAQTKDTLYITPNSDTTQEFKIPNPFIRTALIGGD